EKEPGHLSVRCIDGKERKMAHPLINKAFYDAILHFEESEEAQEYYYKVMDSTVERNGKTYTVRNQILRAYAMLFCDDIGAVAGQIAGPDEVEATADRLHTGNMGFDPRHWYRMQHHFPVIDEDNYDRFAALVIADLNAGPLRDAAIHGGDMLLVGAVDPLHMTKEEREQQDVRVVSLDELGGDNK
ncbi:MAG: hypothetical protein ILP14_01605, partial [Oscillospiraceae bacterium]|nr:hypothetical protein [Oscillospiraceae bacterium]